MATKPPYARDGFEKTIKTMEVKKLFIKDVRCFEGETEFNIRPLTFLVGENSTGKSTALGCMQALHYGMSMEHYVDVRNLRGDIFDGFNISPYKMGTFADIVRNRAGEQFVLGFGLAAGDLAYTHSLTFCSNPNFGILIVKKEWEFKDKSGESFGKIAMTKDPEIRGIHVTAGSRKNHFSIKAGDTSFSRLSYDLHGLINRSHPDMFRYRDRETRPDRKQVSMLNQKKLFDFLAGLPPFNGRYRAFVMRHPRLRDLDHFYSIAPVRSKPKHTYDIIPAAEAPEGDDIPALLMKMSYFEGEKWKKLRGQLKKFGASSEMFKDIAVKRFSRSSPNDPFQLQFKVRKARANIADIGYGVSQVLPILVRIYTVENATFLMQQPEVHLHPKAQAELLSVLADDIKTRGNRYVLETHSDYMLDRARIEIMKDKKIKPEDVSLIYLEPTNGKVAVHNITFDKQGNFVNAPDGYRKFFHKEANDLLGFF